MANKPKIETEEEKKAKELVEGIAQNISKLAGVVRGVINGRMKMHGLVILLASSARMPQAQVERVLKALAEMDSEFLKS